MLKITRRVRANLCFLGRKRGTIGRRPGDEPFSSLTQRRKIEKEKKRARKRAGTRGEGGSEGLPGTSRDLPFTTPHEWEGGLGKEWREKGGLEKSKAPLCGKM